jgi:hypothetical protein
MRMHLTGLGLPPEIDSECLQLWTMDETSTSDPVRSLYSFEAPINLTRNGETQVNSNGNPVGPRYIRLSPVLTTGYLKALITGSNVDLMHFANDEITAGGCIRLVNGYPASDAPLFFFASKEGSATNETPFSIWITSTGLVKAKWTDATATTTYSAVSTYAIPRERWVPIYVVRRTTAAFLTCAWDLYLYGEFVQTLTGDNTFPSIDDSGADTAYYFGRNETGSALLRCDFDHWVVYAAAKSATFIENQMRRVRRIGFPDTFASRISVENAAGSIPVLDESTLYVDWFDGATIKEDVDQAVSTATVKLTREQYDYSLAKLHNNRINRTISGIGPDTETYDAEDERLDVGRRIKVEVQRRPLGTTWDNGGPWESLFYGRIDSIDWGGNDPVITLECRDIASDLRGRASIQQRHHRHGG